MIRAEEDAGEVVVASINGFGTRVKARGVDHAFDVVSTEGSARERYLVGCSEQTWPTLISGRLVAPAPFAIGFVGSLVIDEDLDDAIMGLGRTVVSFDRHVESLAPKARISRILIVQRDAAQTLDRERQGLLDRFQGTFDQVVAFTPSDDDHAMDASVRQLRQGLMLLARISRGGAAP
jgi:hypothetical protein